MNQLPLLYYPTTLYWIDDDGLFLQIAADRFKSDYTIKISLFPQEAIDFFKDYHTHINPLAFLCGLKDYEEYDLTDHLPVDINFDEVRKIQNNPNKITDIAVMIVDYNMPGMSGIELCRQLQSIPTKKILLTGNADFQQAIQAFNEGIIDCFICKDDRRIDQCLAENVNKLSKEYFIEQTAPLQNHIQADYMLPQSDPIFTDFFNQLCEKKNIKEYYLADKNGGIFMIDQQGTASYLVIETDRTLDNFTELHENVKEATFFIKHVQNREKIPFFGLGKEAWDIDATAWSDFFYTPQLLQGRENYYWICIEV